MDKYLFIGDSFTHLLNKYGYIPKDCIVFAKSGTAARDWYDMVSNTKYVDFMKDLYEVNPNDFKSIIYLYGINDSKCSYNVPYSERLLREIRMLFPNKTVYVQRVFPVATKYNGNYNYAEINRDGDYNVINLNKELKNICGAYEMNYIDTTSGFITKYGNFKCEKTDDGLHISKAYYGDWWKNIKKAIGEN